MKLSEAIEIGKHVDDTYQPYTVTVRNRSVKLLIAAGKRYEDLQKYNIVPRWEKLPGETERKTNKEVKC